MKCTGERRYDSSCIQPYIIFGAGTRIFPEQNMCQPLWYWVGQWGGSGNSKQKCSEIDMFFSLYTYSDIAINCSLSI